MPEPLKPEIAPLVTETSPAAKSVVAWLAVKVSERVASLEANGSLPSAAVIVIVGEVLSKVQVNCVAAVLSLPAASLKVPPATSIVHAPFAVGVKVAV